MVVDVVYLLRRDAPGAALRELDLVRLLAPVVTDDGDTIASGTEGTVVAVWENGAAYDVEFPEPMGALATVPAVQLARLAP